MATKDKTAQGGETDEQRKERVAKHKSDCVDILCEMTRETDKGIKRICDTVQKDNPDFPKGSTIQDWIEADEALSGQYARAKDFQIERLAEQILEISDDDSLDMAFKEDGTPFVNTEHIQRSKLRVDSRKWILSKLKPKKYGDKVTMAGDADNPLVVSHKHEMTEAELIAIAAGSSH